MDHLTIALIVARPGPLRNSLQTVLSTLPEIKIVAEARDMSALLHAGIEFQPDLVLIEAEFPDEEIKAALQQIKRDWKQSHTIVLVNSAAQEKMALNAGADWVLFSGCRAMQLIELIESVLSAHA